MNKEPNNIEIIVGIDGWYRRFTLQDIIKALGLPSVPEEIILSCEQHGNCLTASVEPKEAEYPGITVDATDSSGRQMYLANAELPNECFPDSITTRLYAGDSEFENDGPIAITKTKLMTDDDLSVRAEQTKGGRALTKIVYVNTETAQYRPWMENRDMPEHAED